MSVLCILRFPHIDTLETYTANNTEWFRKLNSVIIITSPIWQQYKKGRDVTLTKENYPLLITPKHHMCHLRLPIVDTPD